MITLIMPAYNEEKNIANSIKSIQAQSVQEFELIIINDGSTDNTAAVIETTIQGDSRIKFINPNYKLGKNGAVNLAAKYMSGQWLYFMGADDILPHNALEIWEKAIRDLNPEQCIALRGRMIVKSDNKKYDGLILPKNKERENFSGPLTLQSIGLLKYSLPLPEEYPNEDTWWGLCIQGFAEKKICIDDIIINYRIHDGNSINRKDDYITFNKKYHARYIVRKDFLQKYEEELTDEKKQMLKKELLLEEYRWKGKTWEILKCSGVSFITKMRFVVFSNEILYKIKIHLDRFILGH